MRASIKYPNTQKLEALLTKSAALPFNYPDLGATQVQAPASYDYDHNECQLNQGTFAQAKQSIKNWRMFDLGWVRTYPNHAPIEQGQNVVVSFRLFGLWWHNTCEIVYTIQEPDRFGFAYGTKFHVESGEELFLVQKDQMGLLSYSISAFSRPHFWLTKLVYPLARAYQRRFVRDSMKRMSSTTKKITYEKP